MAYLLIKNGIVENTIAWDGVTPYDPGPEYIILESDVGRVGDTWDGTNFIPAPPVEIPVPPQPTIEELQAQLAALSAQIQALANTAGT